MLSSALLGCYYIICHEKLSLGSNFIQSEKRGIRFPDFSHAKFGM